MEYFTVGKAAEKMSVAEFTVRRWLREGMLKGTKIGAGQLWRISDEAINEFMNKDGKNETA